MKFTLAITLLAAVFICKCHAECGFDALSCALQMGQAVTADAADTKTVCAAYNKMKECLKEKNCNDLTEATKNINFDTAKCSAGMVQISILSLAATLIAAFFTR